MLSKRGWQPRGVVYPRDSKPHKKRALTRLTQTFWLCYSWRMNAFLINLLSEQTTTYLLVLGVGFIVFFFFLRREIRYEIKANIDSVKSELKANIDSVKSELKANIDSVKSELKAEIAPIKVALDNHITDTNKKIDRLSDRIDKLSDRFDRQNDQFSRLYELLLKEKQNESSK